MEVVGFERGTEEHLSRTLRVTNVSEILLASYIEDVINESGKILESKLFLAEVPELGLLRV